MLKIELFSVYGVSLATAEVADVKTALEMATANDDCVGVTVRGPGVYEEWAYCVDWDAEDNETEGWKKLDSSDSLANNYGCNPDVDPDFTIDEVK